LPIGPDDEKISDEWLFSSRFLNGKRLFVKNAMATFPFSFTAVTLDDLDQYQEWANGQGWELNSTQLSRGRD
jgi:hypothetical protein